MPAVLIVCTANRLRSPLAAALLAQHLAESDPATTWRVESAGTWAQAGLPSASAVIAPALAIGIDLRSHRSRPVEDVTLDGYDLILTMERGHVEALCSEAPALAGHIYTLAEMATGYAFDVADPRNNEAVADTVRNIVALAAQAGGRVAAWWQLRLNDTGKHGA